MFASALAAGATVLNASSRGVTAASLSVGWVDARAGMSRSDAIDAIDAAHNSADPNRCWFAREEPRRNTTALS